MPTALLDRAHGRSLADTKHSPYQRAARRGLLRRAWNALAEVGERRAADPWRREPTMPFTA